MKNLGIILAFGVTLLFSACANIGAPTGGPRDTDAPKFVNQASADSILNFKGGTIVLEFDEYIKLQDVQKNFHISPLTKQTPKIKAKRKSLIVELPDSLLESNTTYTLDFGNAVSDIRESNAYTGLKLTMSTGAYFDSLFFNGKITDAETGSGDSIQVMLYPIDMPDSMLLRQKPLYVTRASNGRFSFTGLPAKRFKVAALSDKNNNYIYDARGEKIAFTDKIIDAAQPDSGFIMYSFIEKNMLDTTKASASGGGKNIRRKSAKGIGAPLTYNLLPNVQTEKFDTRDSLVIEIKDTNAIVSTEKIRFYEGPALDLSVQFLYDDSLQQIAVLSQWKMGTDYTIVFQEKFLRDTTGKGTKADTIKFMTMSNEDFGAINVVLDTALFKPGAVLQLLKNNELIDSQAASLSSMRFEMLKPDSYKLRLLYDKNDNGMWDAGDLKKREQPELTIELPKKIRLKPNWEETIEWELGSRKKKRGKK